MHYCKQSLELVLHKKWSMKDILMSTYYHPVHTTTRVDKDWGLKKMKQIDLNPGWVSTLQSLIWIEKCQKLSTVKLTNLDEFVLNCLNGFFFSKWIKMTKLIKVCKILTLFYIIQ